MFNFSYRKKYIYEKQKTHAVEEQVHFLKRRIEELEMRALDYSSEVDSLKAKVSHYQAKSHEDRMNLVQSEESRINTLSTLKRLKQLDIRI